VHLDWTLLGSYQIGGLCIKSMRTHGDGRENGGGQIFSVSLRRPDPSKLRAHSVSRMTEHGGRSMRAAVLPEPGAPLQIERLPVPRPRRGEVLVQVAGCGVCHTDLHVMKGEVAFPTPAVLGHEISGTVVELGEGVEAPAVGTSVVGTFIMPCGACEECQRARDDLCERFFAMNRLRGTLYDGETRIFREDGSPLAMYSMGGMAEYAVVPVTAVFPLPDGAALEESAVLGCAAMTAFGAIRHAGALRGGERVAVVGAGGIGSMIVQFARAHGALQVVAVDISEEKLAAVRALGATETVDATAGDPVAAVVEATAGGADVVFEALGLKQTFVQAFGMLRDGGRMVAVGIAPIGVAAPVEITRLVRRGLQIRGSFGGRPRSDMPLLLALIERGVFDPSTTITRRFPLQQAAEAYGALDRREIVGRAILTTGG
jgi:succinate semialdehyde reductase (NADPH)